MGLVENQDVGIQLNTQSNEGQDGDDGARVRFAQNNTEVDGIHTSEDNSQGNGEQQIQMQDQKVVRAQTVAHADPSLQQEKDSDKDLSGISNSDLKSHNW